MKTIIIALATIFLVSCSLNNSSVKSDLPEKNKEEKHEKIYPGRDSTDLKWQLDPSTRVNVSAIRTVLAQNPDNDDAFIKAGKELKNKTDKLIAECRMKGADHDALHAWLENFVHHLTMLNDRKDNVADWKTLQEDMKRFDKDFQ